MNKPYTFYINPRPSLVIDKPFMGDWKITSTKRLNRETITALFHADVLGRGQDFHLLSRCDGTEDPAGIDEFPATLVEYATRKIIGLSERPQDLTRAPYYVYHVQVNCDSSG